MAYTFRPAIKEETPLLVGLVGPSGSGKTYSALRLATGIQKVTGGKIMGIDTEARRMLHYANRFKFDYLELTPPFSSLRYLEALGEAVRQGGEKSIVIVDSMSHEHEGSNGYLEYHETELQRLAGDDYKKREKNNFSAWIRPAGDRRKLINGLLQLKACFIFCFRAKERLLLTPVDGKIKPVPIGWQAIAGDEFVYEMGVRCLLPPGSKGTPDWSAETVKHGVPKMSEDHVAIFSESKSLDEDTGKALAEWASGGAKRLEGNKPEIMPATKAQKSQINELMKSHGMAKEADRAAFYRFVMVEDNKDLADSFIKTFDDCLRAYYTHMDNEQEQAPGPCPDNPGVTYTLAHCDACPTRQGCPAFDDSSGEPV